MAERDPLEVLRKAMAVHEQRAAVEAKLGEKADIAVVTSSMDKAAQLARTIEEIESRRPPKPEGPQPDLSRLSDKELRKLELLMAKATSTKAPRRKALPELSDRSQRALEIAQWIDRRLEGFGTARDVPLSEEELVWVMASLGGLLSDLTLFSHIALWVAERAGLVSLCGMRRVEEASSVDAPPASHDGTKIVQLSGLPGVTGLRSAPHPQELLRGSQPESSKSRSKPLPLN